MPEKTEHGDDVVVRDGRRFVRTPAGGEIPEEQYLAMFEKAPRAPNLGLKEAIETALRPPLPHVPEVDLLATFVTQVILGVPSASPEARMLVVHERELTAATKDLASHRAINPRALAPMDPDACRARILAGRLEFMAQVLDLPADERFKRELREKVQRTSSAFFGVKRADSKRSAALAIVAAVDLGATARALAVSMGWPDAAADELGAKMARRGVAICEPELADRLDAEKLAQAIERWPDEQGSKPDESRGRQLPTDEEIAEKSTKVPRKWRVLAELCAGVGPRFTPWALQQQHTRWLKDVGVIRNEHKRWRAEKQTFER